LISGYDRASSGAVKVLNADVGRLRPAEIPFFRRRIGVIYQDYRLLRDRSVLENVSMPLLVRGERRSAIEKRAREMLEQVGLGYRIDSYPNEISGGEQQRVAVARALIHHPGVLVADEPTGNLDQEMSAEIFSLLERVNRQGTTVFVATHDRELIDRKPFRVIEIDEGRVVRA
jgi:cell division transport system ATP-binding protein